jgi:hypothetical protein
MGMAPMNNKKFMTNQKCHKCIDENQQEIIRIPDTKKHKRLNKENTKQTNSMEMSSS